MTAFAFKAQPRNSTACKLQHCLLCTTLQLVSRQAVAHACNDSYAASSDASRVSSADHHWLLAAGAGTLIANGLLNVQGAYALVPMATTAGLAVGGSAGKSFSATLACMHSALISLPQSSLAGALAEVSLKFV